MKKLVIILFNSLCLTNSYRIDSGVQEFDCDRYFLEKRQLSKTKSSSRSLSAEIGSGEISDDEDISDGSSEKPNTSGFATWQQLFSHYQKFDGNYTEAQAQKLFADLNPNIAQTIGRSGGNSEPKTACGVPINPEALFCEGYKEKPKFTSSGRSGWNDPTWHSVNEQRISQDRSCRTGRHGYLITDYWALKKKKWCDKRVVTFSVDLNTIDWLDREHKQIRYSSRKFKERFKPKKICRAILKALEVWQSAADLEFLEVPFEGSRRTCSQLISHKCADRYKMPKNILRKVSPDGVGQIRIGFGDVHHRIGRKDSDCRMRLDGNTLAHAYFPQSSGISGDAHFSFRKKWSYRKSTNRYDDTDIFLVAVHEFGHSLGLEHTMYEDDIMYPSYQYKDWSRVSKGETKHWYQYILSSYDIDRIQYKYGSQSDHWRKSCFWGR